MTLKWIGAILIVCACGGFGVHLSAVQKREEKALRELMSIMEYISCELQCRLTPLPQLCRLAAQNHSGNIAKVFDLFARELDMQISPNAGISMSSALSQCPAVPEGVAQLLHQLGSSLGHFDLEGQLKDLNSIQSLCAERMRYLSENRDTRYRTYQTLGLCAGAAIAILLI